MADEDEGEDEDTDSESSEDEESEEGEGGSSGKKKGSKKLLIIIIAAVLLLLIGGGAAAFFMGLLDPLLGSDKPAEVQSGEKTGEDGEGGEGSPLAPAVFHDLPDIQVNLSSSGRKSVLALKIALELVSAEDVPKIEELMPRVMDNFQVYLRELRVNDLKGSAGIYRLREELLTRVNAAIAPKKVKAVLHG